MNKEVTRFRPAFAVLALAVAQALSPAAAQVAPHGSPLDHAQNGVPVVNIQAPSAAGVSHNTYQHFNVDRQGLVLNNTGQVVSTQLAGYVAGNPNITGNGARIILNEVTSASRTQLNGFTEVAGRAAEVIIANPNGITCNGCGFINTTRGTLTTGTPVFGATGSLDAYRVTRGDIRLEGEGLNASYTQRLDLIARQVSVNAKAWANELNVAAGSHQVSRDSLATTVIAGEGAAPGLAIDSSALGGMYANTIRLIATEAGVGVRNDGEVASAGDLSFNAAGDVVLGGRTTAGGALVLRANNVHNTGTLAAQRNLAVNARDITNGGKLYALDGNLDVIAAGGARNNGDIYAKALAAINAGAIVNDGSVQGSDITLVAGTSLAQTGTLRAGGTLQVAGNAVSLGGAVNAGSALFATGQRINLGGTITSGGNAGLQAEDALTQSGQLLAQGDLTLGSAGNAVLNGRVQAGGRLNLGGQNATIASSGEVLAGALATLELAQLRNDGLLQASDITLRQAGDFTNAGRLVGNLDAVVGAFIHTGSLNGGRFDITAGRADVRGSAYASQSARWTIAGLFAQDGTLASAGDLSIDAGSIAASGVLAAGLGADGALGERGRLRLESSGVLVAQGRLLAAQDVWLDGADVNLRNAQLRGGGITVRARDALATAGADLATTGVLYLQAVGRLDNQAGQLQGDTVVIEAASLDNRGGSLVQTGSSAQRLAFAGDLLNTDGRIASNAATLYLQAASFGNQRGAIEHAGGELLTVRGGRFDNSQGRIAGNGHGLFEFDGLVNTGGSIIGESINVAASMSLVNGGTLQASNALVVRTAVLDNGDGAIKLTGATTRDGSASTLDITAGTLRNTGFIGGNGALRMRLDSLFNQGQIYAGTWLDAVVTGDVTNRGAWQALHGFSLVARNLDNDTGVVEAGSGLDTATLSITGGTIGNRRGRIANAGNGQTTVVAADSLVNAGGTLGGQGDLTLRATRIANTGGTLVGNGDVTLAAGSLDNTDGTVYAARTVRWQNGSAGLTNTRGQLGAGLDLALTLAWIDNAGGAVTAQNDVALALGNLLGVGRIIGGRDLALSLAGDYLHVAGQDLKANRNFTLDVGGNFRTQAGSALESIDGLTVRAGAITNDGRLLASRTTLAAGSLQNRGRIEGDVVDINAASIDNTGSVLGGDVTLRAVNLTNGADLGTTIPAGRYDTGLLAATQRLALYVSGTLLNRDAQIFTTGNLTIAANEQGARSGAIINRSGSIEADGNVVLAAQKITNERRVFETSTVALTDAEQAANRNVNAAEVRYRYDDPDPLHHPPYVDASQVISRKEIVAAEAFCTNMASEDRFRCKGYRNERGTPSTFERIITDTVISRTQIDRTSAESRILAGGDIVVSGSLRNDKSTFAAGQNLVVNGTAAGAIGEGTSAIGGERIENIGWVPTATVLRSTALRVLFQSSRGGDSPWYDEGFRTYGTNLDDVTVGLGRSQPAWITLVPGPVAQARLTAGAAVDINGADISLGTVDAAGNLVNPINLGANAGGRPVTGAGNGIGVIGGSTGVGRIGPPPGAQVVGNAQFPAGQITLPTGGLYTVHPDGGSPYLVETDPRFVSYGNFIGSDYLTGRLGWSGEGTLKRLGDAFYEQRLVLDQITSLTGRRFLNHNGDAMAE